jgi:hypothetical protein
MKDSPRFAPTLGGRLAERGLRSANDVYTATGIGDECLRALAVLRVERGPDEGVRNPPGAEGRSTAWSPAATSAEGASGVGRLLRPGIGEAVDEVGERRSGAAGGLFDIR